MRAWLVTVVCKFPRRVWSQVVAGGLLLAILIGCTVQPKSREDETTTDFRQISNVFDNMQGFNNRPPKSMEEIRKMLAELHIDKQCDEPDKVLTSSRDNQPYVIMLGARLGSEPQDALVIFEKEGLDGVRYVMDASRRVHQFNEEQFRQARLADGKRSDAM